MLMTQKRLAVLAISVVSGFSLTPAIAQDNSNQANNSSENSAHSSQSKADSTANKPGNVRPIGQWNYQQLYQSGGVRADRLLEASVLNANGDEIGSVENAILNQDNRIIALIAQVGGMWDIGDTHVAIPWEEIKLTDTGVQVPIREDNVDDYGLFDESYVIKQDLDQATQVEDDVMTGPQTWKITDLLNDYASIDDGEGYGYVTNALFSKEGVLQALVIDPSEERYGQGPYAYPFYGYEQGWRPGDSAYQISYSSEETKTLPTFDYTQYDSPWNTTQANQ
ncbi:PRC-barrel domain-containing protein [Modicisalibacter xianhensis]|uniref:PRC-barrel domain-containing protein n=1 Tax=Modicisalibacter xianhensis TaxID=442341 RepID=A0A1I3BB28_9GAMM|nr:PRC-barrel domain-containing protein [Halomonas xianhensis]SFH59527.1 PRC-barrel domain-containing protein [Halomonas xianhensis]